MLFVQVQDEVQMVKGFTALLSPQDITGNDPELRAVSFIEPAMLRVLFTLMRGL